MAMHNKDIILNRESTPSPVVHNAIVYKQIPFGINDKSHAKPGDQCKDCNALYGQVHHPGCDIERCPVCRRRRTSCGCDDKSLSYFQKHFNNTQ